MGKKSRRKRKSKQDGLSLFRSNDSHARRSASTEHPFAQVTVRVILVSLFLILATLVVYWQVQNHDFLNLDDPDYVTENPHVQRGLTREGVIWAFTSTHASNWHPLTWLSHMLDCQVYGSNAAGHHLTNLLLHIANSLLLLMVLHRMTGAFWRSAFVATLFSLHPVHVESVAWVAERKDVLSTCFWMITMWAYVRYVDRPRPGRYLLVFLSFAMGLMAKPMLVTLPFVLLLLDYWPLGRFQFRSDEATSGSRQSGNIRQQTSFPLLLVLEKAPLFALTAASCVVTFIAQQRGGAIAELPISVRIANALVSSVRYLGKMIWPDPLAVIYPHPGMWPIWQAAGAGLLLLCVSALVIRAARGSPYLAVGWFWYLGTLVPVIGLVHVGSQAMADRYTYIPLIGLFIVIAWGAFDLTARWRFRKPILVTCTGIILSALAACTWVQLRHWHNSISLLKRTLDVTSNNYLAHLNLGAVLLEQGNIREATEHFSRGLEINPRVAALQDNMGVALAKQGRLDEAIEHFSRALQIGPDGEEAHNNMGLALSEQGRLDEAIEYFSRGLQIKPDDAVAHNNIGLALARQGNIEEAAAHFSTALEIDPHNIEVENNLRRAHQQLSGRLEVVPSPSPGQ